VKIIRIDKIGVSYLLIILITLTTCILQVLDPLQLQGQDNNETRAFFQSAIEYQKNKQYKKALKEYDRLLKKAAGQNITITTELRRNMAICKFETGKYKTALRMFFLLLKEDQSNFQSLYYYYIGQALIKQRKFKEAVQALIQCIRLKGEYSRDAVYYLAIAYAKQKNKPRAKKYFESYLKFAQNKELKNKAKRHLVTIKEYDEEQKSMKDSQWNPNLTAFVIEEDYELLQLFDILYMMSAVGVEQLLVQRVTTTAIDYTQGLHTVSEQVLAPGITIGVGPLSVFKLASRMEYNLYSNSFTNWKTIKRYQENDDAPFPLSGDKWYIIHELMIDQNYTFKPFTVGYNFLFDYVFLDILREDGISTPDSSARRILPWIALEYWDIMRSRVFTSLEYHPNFVDSLLSYQVLSFHGSQDIFFPEYNSNIYFEGFYKKLAYGSQMFDRSDMGGMMAADVGFANWFIVRLLGIYQKSYYDKPRLRLPKASDVSDIMPNLDRENRLQPETIDLSTTQTSFELNFFISFWKRHAIRFRMFYDVINSDHPSVVDYSFQEVGLRLEYDYGIPDLKKIRRRIRYGIFGLF